MERQQQPRDDDDHTGHATDESTVSAEDAYDDDDDDDRSDRVSTRPPLPPSATTTTVQSHVHQRPHPRHLSVVLFDCEATCGNDVGGIPMPNRIIEIGSVFCVYNVSRCVYEPVETYQRFVRPTGGTRLSEFCVRLTGITQEDIDVRGVSIRQALCEHKKWWERLARSGAWGTRFPTTIVTWGPSDMEWLHRDAVSVLFDYRTGVLRRPYKRYATYYDAQSIYHRFQLDARRIGVPPVAVPAHRHRAISLAQAHAEVQAVQGLVALGTASVEEEHRRVYHDDGAAAAGRAPAPQSWQTGGTRTRADGVNGAQHRALSDCMTMLDVLNFVVGQTTTKDAYFNRTQSHSQSQLQWHYI